jgi:hypothetical protein
MLGLILLLMEHTRSAEGDVSGFIAACDGTFERSVSGAVGVLTSVHQPLSST